jgi:hypothetical protein
MHAHVGRTSSTRCLAIVLLYRLHLRHCATISSCNSAVRARRAEGSSMACNACKQATILICARSAADAPANAARETSAVDGGETASAGKSPSACSKWCKEGRSWDIRGTLESKRERKILSKRTHLKYMKEREEGKEAEKVMREYR